jgi:antitoxin MazE
MGGEDMRVQIQKWGHSLALRIPKGLAKKAAVREGMVVVLSLTGGRLIVEPDVKGRITLRRLLRKVTGHNLHGEVDFGSATEREARRDP